MIGTTLQNRYRLDAELGHGGMGTVYRAHDTLLDLPSNADGFCHDVEVSVILLPNPSQST